VLKTCNTCKREKPLEAFYLLSKEPLYYRRNCIECKSLYDKQYSIQYKHRRQELNKISCAKNADKRRKATQEWRSNNKDRVLAYKRKYEKEKRANDPVYKLNGYLRQRLNKARKRGSRGGSAVRDLGCTMEQLKDWIERQWEQDMSWDNYGNKKGEWSIDHEYPPLLSRPLQTRTAFTRGSLYESSTYVAYR
jgi:hypothetical protein